MAEEIWKDIEGFPGYQVSDHGNVRSYKRHGPGKKFSETPRLLKPMDKNKSMRVTLWADGKADYKLVHRLIAEAFIGPDPSTENKRFVVAHWDGDPTNNNVSNLRWATYEENFRDYIRHLEEKCCSHCPKRKENG